MEISSNLVAFSKDTNFTASKPKQSLLSKLSVILQKVLAVSFFPHSCLKTMGLSPAISRGYTFQVNLIHWDTNTRRVQPQIPSTTEARITHFLSNQFEIYHFFLSNQFNAEAIVFYPLARKVVHCTKNSITLLVVRDYGF